MKNKIKKSLYTFFVAVLLLGFGILPDAEAKKKHKHYKYIYYPSSQVYYSPVAHRYYYMDNGAWIYRSSPPATVRLGNSVSIELGGSTPYVYHPTVIQQYPVVVVP